ncbi:BPI fold-containing family C protein [Trichosurus vulpecula]|uniref:BPI fold-containing family C protein n=1 Tax=Trichosurus vulpecula TaxID=9337 RepID=UPI00186B286A|nr:BPI fold-containing family C protein [Trichosurus vulpecula]
MEVEKILVLWGCFLLWNPLVQSTQLYPGIKVRITQKGLDYGTQAGMEVIELIVKKNGIPDFKGSESLEFLKVDYVDYNFSNIKINTFSFPNISLTPVSGAGVKVLSNHGSTNISMGWEITSPLFRDEGGATLFLAEIFFSGLIHLSRSDTGHPNMKLQDCYVRVGHARISFSGELSVLYNSFAEPMEKPILKNLNKKLCPIIMDQFEHINANISSLEVVTKFGEDILLDYSLLEAPEVTQSAIDLNLKGTFYQVGNLTDPPFQPVPFTLPDRSDSMLYIGISEYFLKSASFTYFITGAFNITLSTKELSKHLIQNPQSIGSLFSQIAELYIMAQPLMMRILTTEPPVVNLEPNNFTLNIPGSVVMLTKPKNATEEAIVSMDFVANTGVGLAILGQKLVCSLSLNRFRLSGPESNRSSIEVLRFENILSSILHFGVFPLANARLQQGFPLPNPHQISLIKPDIEVHKGFLLISTDLRYDPLWKKQHFGD